MTYADEELEALLADTESDLVERKRSAADQDKIRRTICAFANDLPAHGRPGVLFIGVEDDGGCAKLPVTDEVLRRLSQPRADGSMQPLPSLVVQKRKIAGCELAVVIVQPSADPPVRYKGRVWIRVGATVQQATPEEEQWLAERRRASNLTFDRRPAAGATLDDLDLDYVRSQYLPRAIAAEVLEQNQRPLEQQLRSLRLIAESVPTYGALLAFGRDPQRWLPGAYVQFLRIDGNALTDPLRDQKALTGRLDDVLRRLEDLLELCISVRTDVTSGPRELRQPDYPLVALQQFARNAVMHRSYEGTNAPVHVYWYDDRVELTSPGGPYGSVTRHNFGTGVTDYRNPLVAEIMHHLGFAQRFGLGLPLAREALEKNGNPAPGFDPQPTTVAVTVRPAS